MREQEGGVKPPSRAKSSQFYAVTGTAILWKVEVTTSEV
jgi:hypothetical protein